MNYAVFVEGPDDNRFIEDIVKREINHRRFSTMQYSEEPDGNIDSAIDAFQGMHREVYLLRDYDYGKQDCTCIDDRKTFVKKKYSSMEDDQIIIVSDAIEAWYLAGLTDTMASELGIEVPDNTDQLGKSKFEDKLQESDFKSKVNFQMNIIQRYSLQEAKSNNQSFEYFANKLGL